MSSIRVQRVWNKLILKRGPLQIKAGSAQPQIIAFRFKTIHRNACSLSIQEAHIIMCNHMKPACYSQEGGCWVWVWLCQAVSAHSSRLWSETGTDGSCSFSTTGDKQQHTQLSHPHSVVEGKTTQTQDTFLLSPHFKMEEVQMETGLKYLQSKYAAKAQIYIYNVTREIAALCAFPL